MPFCIITKVSVEIVIFLGEGELSQKLNTYEILVDNGQTPLNMLYHFKFLKILYDSVYFSLSLTNAYIVKHLHFFPCDK